MSIDTFLRKPRSGDEPVAGANVQGPGSFSVSTQLMQDAVPAVGVSVGDGRNQEALFANPFKSGREEALVVNRQGQLTYLERTDTSSTGWVQEPVTQAPPVAEVVVAVHPSGDVWAICSPKDTSNLVFGLTLALGEREADGTARCVWQGMTSFNKVGLAAQAMTVSYAPDGGALILGTSVEAESGPTNLVLTPQLKSSDGSGGGWYPEPTAFLVQGHPLVGGGYLPYFSSGKQPGTYVYYSQDGQKLLRWEERIGQPVGDPLQVTTACAQFCGAYHQPYLNRDNPQGDIGFLYVDTHGSLVWGYRMSPGGHLVTGQVNDVDFAAKTRLWQDADGKMHVFGLDEDATLKVLHQAGWETVSRQVGPDRAQTLQPKWTQARVASAPPGIGGYDLARPNDRIVAFDYARSGYSDHLFAYRPGPTHYYSDQTVWVVKRTAEVGGFDRAFSNEYGLPGYDFSSPDDRVVAYDYTGSGSADHLLAYRPGAGKFSIFKKRDGQDGFVSVAGAAAGGIGGGGGTYTLADRRDRLLPFDYLGNKKNDHLLAYRPGTGTAWVLAPQGDGSFTPVARSSTGLGGFRLNNPADEIAGLDYDSKGSSTHLLAYRPGTGMVYILTPDKQGGFDAVLHHDTGGIGGWDLMEPEDRLVPFDYSGTGCNNHILTYRPGDIPGHSSRQAWVLRREGDTTTYRPSIQGKGLGGYDFASLSDLVTGLDYNGTGGLSYLVAYRPGAGKVSVMGQRGADNIAPVYQAPPAPSSTVTVGVHAGVVDYQLDPYPDYKPSELIKMSGTPPAEAYCVCTQDVTTSQWQMDKVRLPEPVKKPGELAPPPDVVSHYVADVTLLSKLGQPMPGHPVSVSADSLVEVQIAEISYQVGPGRPIAVATSPMGKLALSIAARGLNPPVVHLNADGLQSGTAIDFAAQANDFLAGNATLPSQNGTFTPDLLEHAKVPSNMPGVQEDPPPLADWTALKERGLTPQIVVDHCTNMYGQAAGNKQLQPALLDGFDEPQPIIGYVIQLWDPDRPAYQAFRTRDELDAYRSYRNAHPAYGGWWDDFTSWASDVWEGIKTGAAKVAEVIVTTITEIAIWVGDAIVSLGEMVIEAIEQAIQAVEAVFQMIADAIMRVIDWLKSLFALGAIWNTKVALEEAVHYFIPLFSSTITYAQGQMDGWLIGARKKINDALDELVREYGGTRMGDFGNKVPAAVGSTGTQVNTGELNTPQANWMQNKALSGTEAYRIQFQDLSATGIEDELAVKFTEMFATFGASGPQALFGKLEDLYGQVENFCTVDSGAGADRSAFESIIDMLRTLIDAVLDTISAVADKAFEAAASAAASFWDLFNKPLTTPFGLLEALYEWIHQQARPGEPPETLTLGRLILLVAAFFMTVIHKLIHGVDQEPFPRDKGFPKNIPLPVWDPRHVPSARGEEDPPPDWALNDSLLTVQEVIGVFAAVFDGFATLGTDLVALNPSIGNNLLRRVVNGMACFGKFLSLTVTCPPVLGSKWEQTEVTVAWGMQVGRFGCDVGLTAIGHLIKSLGGRSTLLKNAGRVIDDVHHMIEGSAGHLILGGVSMGCGLAGVIKYPPDSKGLTQCAIASTVLGNAPDVLQVFRTIARAISRDAPATKYIIGVVAVLDGLSVAGSDLLISVPAIVERYNLPSIDPTNPPDATVGVPYTWTFKGTGGQSFINDSKKFAFYQEMPAWLTDKDETTGTVSGTPTSSDVVTPPVKFLVACHDGFAPPQGKAAEFTITVKPK
ncbi:hypothetical protein [Streptomyces sp. RKAG293]|uniref:hypothetical protein n=1 Tax=Streptomyces sp. RKAG293 TaxID=2893403 RepID=UPI0020346984|nr:hypothetical protein [Streptomyces sp. RKAG293]MCM2422823.1 hypothetical protein [Streptomyces sp. RKAG293]